MRSTVRSSARSITTRQGSSSGRPLPRQASRTTSTRPRPLLRAATAAATGVPCRDRSPGLAAWSRQSIARCAGGARNPPAARQRIRVGLRRLMLGLRRADAITQANVAARRDPLCQQRRYRAHGRGEVARMQSRTRDAVAPRDPPRSGLRWALSLPLPLKRASSAVRTGPPTARGAS